MKKQIENVKMTFEEKTFQDPNTKKDLAYIEIFAYINGEAVRLKVHQKSESLLRYFMHDFKDVK